MSITIWFAAVFSVKVSILLFYMRLFSPVKRLICVAWAVITISGLLCFLGVLLSVFLCNPNHESWDSFVDRKCKGSGLKGEFAFGLLNIVLDLVVLVLPLPRLWQLKGLDIKPKVMLSMVFSFGLMYVHLTGANVESVVVILTVLVPALLPVYESSFFAPTSILTSSSLGSSCLIFWSLRWVLSAPVFPSYDE